MMGILSKDIKELESQGEIRDEEIAELQNRVYELEKQLGYKDDPDTGDFIPSDFSMADHIKAICDYLEVDAIKISPIKVIKRKSVAERVKNIMNVSNYKTKEK